MKKNTSPSTGIRAVSIFKTLIMVFVFTFSNLAFSQADLVPIQVNLDIGVSAIQPGDVLPASCITRNIGDAGAAASSVGFYLSDDIFWDALDDRLGGDAVAAIACCKTNSANAAADSLLIPGGTSLGIWYILFVANEDTVVIEKTDTNNVKFKEFKVGAQPDLIPVNMALSDAGPVIAGSSITATCKVENQGLEAAGSLSKVAFYFSTDQTLGLDDVLLGSELVGNVAALDESLSKSASLILPIGTPTGNYFILFSADDDGQVSESNESNNVGSKAIAVDTNLLDPNHKPIGITLVAPNPTPAGTSVHVAGKVRNADFGPSGSGSRVAIYLSTDNVWDGGDIELASRFIGNLPGKTTSGVLQGDPIIPPSTPTGAYFILYVADVDDDVVESNETDNVRNEPINIINNGLLADLTPVMARVYPGPINSGSSFIGWCKIANIGLAASGGQSFVGFYLSTDNVWDGADQLLNTESINDLAAGDTTGSKSKLLTIPGATPTGDYYILYVADYTLIITESDESNNVVAEAIHIDNVPQTVDLVPINVNIVLPVGGVTVGNDVPVSCKIRNLGSSFALSTTVGFWLSDNPIWDASDTLLGELPVEFITCCKTNSTIKNDTLTIPATTPNGLWYILYVADNDTTEAESNEANNVKFKGFDVIGNPLLPVISKTTVEPVLDDMFDLKQFPNPSQGQLFVEFTSLINSNETVALQVYDASGRIMLDTEFDNVEKGVRYELDLSELASGFYNVIYTSNDKVLTKRLILTNN